MSVSLPSPESAADLGRQVRAHREASGRRQRDVAAAAGLEPAALSRLELGEAGDVQVNTVAKVAAVLGFVLRLVPRGEGVGGDHRAA